MDEEPSSDPVPRSDGGDNAASDADAPWATAGGPAGEALPPWHALPLDVVTERLACDLEGLDEAEAQRRLATLGPNRLPEPPPIPGWTIFLRQFKSPLIYVLLVAAAVSLALGLLDDAVFILGVLLLNAVIGFVQESRAEKDIRALGRLLVTRVRVQRGGHYREIDSAELVPGDVVWLESGVKVPADLRLMDARGLRVDQSLLTGESLPVEKAPGAPLPRDTPPSDQRTMVFSGTTVFQGRAEGLVVGTGLRTQVGLIATELQRQEPVKPPLLIRMERFTRVIALVVLGLCVAVFTLGLLRGDAWSEMLLAALALAVSAIPEGLPVALTVALAIAVNRMARRQVLVRRLEAVEALGSCSVIGSDKTGTLTTNQLTVVRGTAGGVPFRVTGAGLDLAGRVELDRVSPDGAIELPLQRLLRAGALCNEAELIEKNGVVRVEGDPVDAALLVLAVKGGVSPAHLLQTHPRTNAIPFEPERRYAASFHRRHGGGLVVAKGAPERIVAMCSHAWSADAAGPEPLVPEAVTAALAALTDAGYRALALAEREDPTHMPARETPDEPAGMTLIGLVGMADPPRPEVADAVAACGRAGVRVVMITGDHLATARAIAREIGLLPAQEEPPAGAVCDGPALEAMDDAALAAAVDPLSVVGRATPGLKLRVVQALRRRGHFVAVTGDGVNDAPALRAANIGVAMGRGGTDVARDAADLVITDDHFASIVAGVEEGRVAYDNVRKVIYLLVSTGLGEVLAVLLAMAAALPVPFLPAQLLWLNLVTNGVQDVALAFEPREDDVLGRPPRPSREGIFNRLMVERTVLACLVFGGVSFALYAWLLREGHGVAEARGMVFNLFVVFELLHLGNSRSETRSLFRISPVSNPFLLLGTVSALGIHVAALNWPPMQAVLGATLPTPEQAVLLVGMASSILLVMEAHKWLWQQRHPRRP